VNGLRRLAAAREGTGKTRRDCGRKLNANLLGPEKNGLRNAVSRRNELTCFSIQLCVMPKKMDCATGVSMAQRIRSLPLLPHHGDEAHGRAFLALKAVARLRMIGNNLPRRPYSGSGRLVGNLNP
jgi:hypothetical protein